ncbi:MAG: hypothetical protein RLZZ126_77 [Pseudomonadota bacterium]|jgi:diadenosine tetraphosphatase ApaH/serine/threonine PP2A family protein phosphatase
MRLALLSDIHANLLGMQACIAHAREQGADQLALLGDFVGYGPEPAAVLELARDLADDGAWLIQGNHDEMVLDPPAVAQTLGEITALWTHHQLGPEHLAFLRRLPLQHQHDKVLLVHASADEPAAWRYVYHLASAQDSLEALSEQPGKRFSFVGHVHAQTLYSRDEQGAVTLRESPVGQELLLDSDWHWLATVGSAGQPRDGDPRAMYSLFDTAAETLCFHRVAYDHHAAAARVRKAGLPEWLAQRLELGR